VLIGSGLGLLAKSGAGVPATALATFPVLAAVLLIGAVYRRRRAARPEPPAPLATTRDRTI
jgi:hypothetical protein